MAFVLKVAGGSARVADDEVWIRPRFRPDTRSPRDVEIRWWIALALFLAIALIDRAPLFGNPVIQVDEQFYLLAGDRLLHGDWPFVAIWDRKPIGLFLLYAGLRGLGGNGILAYQVAATLSVAATALVIERMARRIAPAPGALLAGALYILCLPMVGGIGGQAPVFYNLPVAVAAWIILRLVEGEHGDRALTLRGAGAMLLVGVAIQIKYTVMFEGAFFGIVLVLLSLRERADIAATAARAALWASIAFLPTMIAFAGYVLAGHGQDFLFANFWSIFLRSDDPADQTAGRFWTIVAMTAPLVAAGAVAPFIVEAARYRLPLAFALAWAVVACLGVVAFGSYFDHYALPLFVPLCLAAAPALGHGKAGQRAGVALIAASLVVGTIVVRRNITNRGSEATVAPIVAMIGERPRGCVYVFDGDPIIYHLTQSCLLTRWPFPPHLANHRESAALGVDAVAETRRIMAQRPAWVVTTRGPDSGLTNRTDAAIVDSALAADYQAVLSIPVGKRQRMLYRLRAS